MIHLIDFKYFLGNVIDKVPVTFYPSLPLSLNLNIRNSNYRLNFGLVNN